MVTTREFSPWTIFVISTTALAVVTFAWRVLG